jgi:uncharacterized protein YndB with AHSA1/START domain
MSATATMPAETAFRIEKEIDVNAPIAVVWESVLEELGPGSQMPDGTPFPLKIEAWPGGRWFRDLGNNTGHFWAHVQVIKPPKLIEFSGPMMMSYPAINHVQYRLTEEGGRTKVGLVHRAFGDIDASHRDGMNKGWQYKLDRIKVIADRRSQKH